MKGTGFDIKNPGNIVLLIALFCILLISSLLSPDTFFLNFLIVILSALALMCPYVVIGICLNGSFLYFLALYLGGVKPFTELTFCYYLLVGLLSLAASYHYFRDFRVKLDAGEKSFLLVALVAVFFAWCILNWALLSQSYSGLKKLGFLAAMSLVPFSCGILLQDRQIIKKLLYTLIILGVVLGTVNLLLSALLSVNPYSAYADMAPSTVDVSYSTGIAVLGLAFLAAASDDLRRKVTFSCAAAILLYSMALTGARGPLLSLFITVLFFLLWPGAKLRKRGAGPAAVLVGAMVISMLLLPDRPRQRIMWWRHKDTPSGREAAISNEGRSARYKTAARDFLNHPVLGKGLGNFRTEYNLDYRKMSYAHNTILEVASETGLLGLTLFLAILIFAVINLLRSVFFLSPENESRNIILLILLLFTYTLTESMFSGTVFQWAILWFAAGFSLVAGNIVQKEKAAHAQKSLHSYFCPSGD